MHKKQIAGLYWPPSKTWHKTFSSLIETFPPLEWVHEESTINDKVTSSGEVTCLLIGQKHNSRSNVFRQSSMGQRLESCHHLLLGFITPNQKHGNAFKLLRAVVDLLVSTPNVFQQICQDWPWTDDVDTDPIRSLFHGSRLGKTCHGSLGCTVRCSIRWRVVGCVMQGTSRTNNLFSGILKPMH